MPELKHNREELLGRFEAEDKRGGFSWEHMLPSQISARKLLDSYARWTPPAESARQEIELFAPTLLNSQSVENISFTNAKGVKVSEWIKGLLHLCLYADRVFVPDPLEFMSYAALDDARGSMFIGIHLPLMHNVELCLEVARALRELQPLIDAGIVVLYPALICYFKYVAEGLFGERRAFRSSELQIVWPDLYVAEGLFYASAFQASYTALHAEEYASLELASKNMGIALGLGDRKLLASLPRMKLPFFEGLAPDILVQARKNESAFEDFRTVLREMTADLTGGLEDPGFDNEVARLEKDRVASTLNKLQQDVTGITSLKARLSEAPIDFIAGTLATGAVKADAVEALLAGTVGMLTKGLAKLILSRAKVRPAASTVYSFHTGKVPSLWLDLRYRSVRNRLRG